jgi:coenzyme F420-reducing hydrogenase delta subunit/NAD-dependent dihydropyrimidine dehydrogenase PreA subunit
VARVSRPQLYPPRLLTWGAVGLLFLVAVLWPVGVDREADLLRIPTDAPVDMFYGFWLPIAERVSGGAMWGAFLVVATVLLAVPFLTRPRGAKPLPSVVDQHSCTGCEQCYHDCPYEAITMIERTDGRPGMVASVDPTLCVSCGICAGSCAPMVVGPPGRNGRSQLASVKQRLAERPVTGRIVLIGCERAAALAADVQEREDLALHPVSCAGSLHTSVIEHYLSSGAAGVMVVSCPPRDCWNREGAKWVEERMFHGREAELQERVDRERVHLAYAGATESALLEGEIAGFRARLARLGLVQGETDIDLIALCDRALEAGALVTDVEVPR